jgi:hypothetical protein
MVAVTELIDRMCMIKHFGRGDRADQGQDPGV